MDRCSRVTFSLSLRFLLSLRGRTSVLHENILREGRGGGGAGLVDDHVIDIACPIDDVPYSSFDCLKRFENSLSRWCSSDNHCLVFRCSWCTGHMSSIRLRVTTTSMSIQIISVTVSILSSRDDLGITWSKHISFSEIVLNWCTPDLSFLVSGMLSFDVRHVVTKTLSPMFL